MQMYWWVFQDSTRENNLNRFREDIFGSNAATTGSEENFFGEPSTQESREVDERVQGKIKSVLSHSKAKGISNGFVNTYLTVVFVLIVVVISGVQSETECISGQESTQEV